MRNRKIILSKLKKVCGEVILAATNNDQSKLERSISSFLVSVKTLSDNGLINGEVVLTEAENILKKLSKIKK